MSNEDKSNKGSTHRFHFSKDGVATCSCGRWTLAKLRMTGARALVATKYTERFGPHINATLEHGVPFKELSEDEAIKDWGIHVKNLPEKGGRIHGCSYIKKQRTQQGELIAA